MAKILVADDNSNIQKMVGLALKDQGIDVVAVGNGEAAVRKISDIRPDLVLADVFMPVRNGYEVCRYVKEDSALSHIPVILLVGAFDPLDEQEAQRVGADGVLKKPFVPPDPLISMVKSALTRAGVPTGDEPANPAKTPPQPAPAQRAKEFSPIGGTSKTTPASPAPIPEAPVEPVLEDFPAPPPSVKIAAGTEPVAFGSLLETPGTEEDSAYMSKPTEALEAARKWGAEAETDEEAEEDEKSGHGWRPGGLDAIDDAALPAADVKDWREEAFHGSSPAGISTGRRWTPAEATQFTETAEAPSVGVSALPGKPGAAPTPFAGDAWAAAMATTIEETVSAKLEAPAAMDEAAIAPAPVEEPEPVVDAKPADAKSADTGSWAIPSDNPWELEAKKASMLAATWDAPVAEPPAPAAEAPSHATAEKFLAEEPVAGAPEIPNAVINELVEQEQDKDSFQTSTEFVQEAQAQEMAGLATGSSYSSAELLDGNATQEVPVYSENEMTYASAPLTEELASPADEPVDAGEIAQEAMPISEPEPVTAATPAATQPNMDELVARVLAKMNPDVMQKVTQEILKPVIEALIKDELNPKK